MSPFQGDLAPPAPEEILPNNLTSNHIGCLGKHSALCSNGVRRSDFGLEGKPRKGPYLSTRPRLRAKSY